jgi:NADH-quinone oxidoreductase subunit J
MSTSPRTLVFTSLRQSCCLASQYLLAAAEFVAISQVMVYIGAVMVLFLFGIMLTRATIGEESDLNNKNWSIGIPVALLLAGTLVWVIVDQYGGEVLTSPEEPMSTTAISDVFLREGLAPFLALSFVLLAAAIGAIVLARKD